jgi:putative endonuclease
MPAKAGIHENNRQMNTDKQYYCYIMASQKKGTLYVGVTSDLLKRVYEHKAGQSHFTKKYIVDRLVWFETHQSIEEAILREKRLKLWKRDWKIRLIEDMNPQWQDRMI